VDRLKQLREPAAMVALVGLVLHCALTLVYFLVAPAPFDPFLVDLALSLMSPGLVALLAILVATCWIDEATPRARGLTVLGLILTAGLVAAAAGLLVAGLVSAQVDPWAGLFRVFPWVVPWLTTAVIALGVFVALLRRPSVASASAVTAEIAPPEPVPAPPVDPQLQPGWSPDTAVGTVWRRAGDAAAGAPATSWDATGQSAGWWRPTPATETSPYAPSDQPTDPPAPTPPPAEQPGARADESPRTLG
jgi:hypothetical protein